MGIRLGTPSDAFAIARVHVEAWRAAYRGILPVTYLEELSVERRAAMWTTVLASPDAIVLAAVDGERIVGFVSAAAARDDDVDRARVGEIGAIYLLEEMWGAGVGSELFEHACDAIRDRGFAELLLWVLAENTRARLFYERKGMTLDTTANAVLTAEGVDYPEVRYRRSLMR